VVKGEYGISSLILSEGFNFDTLMLKYKGIDWRNNENWRCNNNVHPSRIGMYDGFSQHPLETVFIKTSWGVGEPFSSKYSAWIFLQHLKRGGELTQGCFDRDGYYISTEKSSFPKSLDKSRFILGEKMVALEKCNSRGLSY
jgi:hypothetical protein